MTKKYITIENKQFNNIKNNEYKQGHLDGYDKGIAEGIDDYNKGKLDANTSFSNDIDKIFNRVFLTKDLIKEIGILQRNKI